MVLALAQKLTFTPPVNQHQGNWMPLMDWLLCKRVSVRGVQIFCSMNQNCKLKRTHQPKIKTFFTDYKHKKFYWNVLSHSTINWAWTILIKQLKNSDSFVGKEWVKQRGFICFSCWKKGNHFKKIEKDCLFSAIETWFRSLFIQKSFLYSGKF